MVKEHIFPTNQTFRLFSHAYPFSGISISLIQNSKLDELFVPKPSLKAKGTALVQMS